MNDRYIHRIWTAVLAFGLGVAVACGAHAAPGKAGVTHLLDDQHSAAGVTCSDCHGDGARTRNVTQEACVSCHSRGKLVAKTEKVQPLNPHVNRHYANEAECGLCHRQHTKSVNFCLDCHPRFDFKVK